MWPKTSELMAADWDLPQPSEAFCPATLGDGASLKHLRSLGLAVSTPGRVSRSCLEIKEQGLEGLDGRCGAVEGVVGQWKKWEGEIQGTAGGWKVQG